MANITIPDLKTILEKIKMIFKIETYKPTNEEISQFKEKLNENITIALPFSMIKDVAKVYEDIEEKYNPFLVITSNDLKKLQNYSENKIKGDDQVIFNITKNDLNDKCFKISKDYKDVGNYKTIEVIDLEELNLEEFNKKFKEYKPENNNLINMFK